ncbi:tyrosine-type recombinase/integrase [Cupriavidus sp. SS-3]|uniref:tyrosine-type recombinase/integrase n=1 Tax=Cupriavidus sp. SS-3 TaxID=3109596 RepID=UPI002DB71C91|nr:tyrosine-type recombinase/integrase [Cupriavidus sp. SS-3]MEC3769049.1 tyrosine-type recombinase/integrase [Cupriavidus sp. SS-3]
MRPKINLRAAMAQVGEHQAADLTFAELIDAYSAVQFDGADLRLRKWKEAFGHLAAWTLTTRDISLAAEAMLQSGLYQPSTINRDTSTIGTVYKWAVRRHLAPAGFVSPTLGLQRYEEGIRRVEISDREIRAILNGAHAFRDRRFAVFVRLSIETGGRRGEIRERRWRDVDLDSRTITVMQTKTDKPRQLFFSEDTAALMRRVWPKRDPDALLFESKVKGQPVNYRNTWAKLTRAIGRPDLHLHDLRHHRAAELLRAGTTLAVASQVLGHSSLILQRRYGHLESKTLREATERSWRTAA